jgi:nucleoside-specific outer membrane channel protein Tsx
VETRSSEKRSPWGVGFSLGFNLSPKGTIKTTVSGAAQEDVSPKFSNSLSLMGEASYRSSDYFRFVAEMGLSQLQDSVTSDGNETSFFDIRPELIFPLSSKTELYLGPMVGLYFFTQNANTNFRQQNAMSFLLGGALGVDFALSDQFDLGFFVRYFKPADLKLTGTSSGGAAINSTISVSYQTVGARFMIHF